MVWKDFSRSLLRFPRRRRSPRVLRLPTIQAAAPNQHRRSESNSIIPPRLRTVRFPLPAIRCVPNSSSETSKSPRRRTVMMSMPMSVQIRKRIRRTRRNRPFPPPTSSPAGIRRFSREERTAWKSSPFPPATTKRSGSRRSVPAEWPVPRRYPRGTRDRQEGGMGVGSKLGAIKRRRSQNHSPWCPKNTF